MGKLITLSESEEKQFQEFMNKNPNVKQWRKEFIQQFGEEPPIDKSDYDYRKAWKSGVVPEPDKYDDNKMHWSSSTSSGEMLKQEGHKTLWKELYMRKHKVNPDKVIADMAKEENITKQQAEKILEQRFNKRPLMKNKMMENE